MPATSESAARPPAPYLRRSSPAYEYHRLVWGGLSTDEAAAAVEAHPDTARKWRNRLRQAASAHVGRPVSYLYALRLQFDRAVPRDDAGWPVVRG